MVNKETINPVLPINNVDLQVEQDTLLKEREYARAKVSAHIAELNTNLAVSHLADLATILRINHPELKSFSLGSEETEEGTVLWPLFFDVKEEFKDIYYSRQQKEAWEETIEVALDAIEDPSEILALCRFTHDDIDIVSFSQWKPTDGVAEVTESIV